MLHKSSSENVIPRKVLLIHVVNLIQKAVHNPLEKGCVVLCLIGFMVLVIAQQITDINQLILIDIGPEVFFYQLLNLFRQ